MPKIPLKQVAFADGVVGPLKGATFAVFDNGSSGAAKTVNWNNGNKQKLTLTAACTITFTAPPGVCDLLLVVTQDSTPRIITWPATVKWPSGVKQAASTGSGAIDLFAFYFDGTNYLASRGAAFA